MKKILIVEDEAACLKLFKDQLTKNGYKVIGATDGKKGLEKAKSEHPNLILLDLKLPVMDGLAMLDLLRKDESNKNLSAGRQVKVIILTNLEPDEKIIAGIICEQPSYYFVKSDTKFDALLKKIKELLTE